MKKPAITNRHDHAGAASRHSATAARMAAFRRIEDRRIVPTALDRAAYAECKSSFSTPECSCENRSTQACSGARRRATRAQ